MLVALDMGLRSAAPAGMAQQVRLVRDRTPENAGFPRSRISSARSRPGGKQRLDAVMGNRSALASDWRRNIAMGASSAWPSAPPRELCPGPAARVRPSRARRAADTVSMRKRHLRALADQLPSHRAIIRMID
jgi:hypothetical protein